MITNLASMMHERLDLFRMRNNKKLPERILVYRDGVSEVCDLLPNHERMLTILILGPIAYRCQGRTPGDESCFQEV